MVGWFGFSYVICIVPRNACRAIIMQGFIWSPTFETSVYVQS